MEKKISVIIPAYKNEKLEYTVNSVREFADEIIIVNSSHSKIDYSSITNMSCSSFAIAVIACSASS